MNGQRMYVATNNGEVGGGEVMLLAVASAARDLGVEVHVVAPTGPDGLLDRARSSGFPVVPVRAHDRRSWMRGLRSWDATRSGLLWCNGLVPATATARRPDRVVALHQQPQGLQRAARALATAGAREVLVPSVSMGRSVPHTRVLANWTAPIDPLPPRRRDAAEPLVVGFLGRLTREKGVDVLARAVDRLVGRGRDVRLLLGGETRFGSAEDVVALERALAPLGDRVERLGWVEPLDLFARADVVAFPSVWPEPFGLVAAEAMAAAVPCVVSDAGALPEVVGEAHPWVARAGDDDHLAGVLAAALDAAPDRRAAVVAQGRERWERLWSPDAGRDRLGSLLASWDAGVSRAPGEAAR